jgi:sec-independent protein translocase protein TatC
VRRLRPPIAVRRVRPDERLTVVEHLDELRRRVLVSAAALVVAFIAMYAIHEQLLSFLQRPLPAGEEARLLTLSPTEPFYLVIKVSFWAAVLVALPVWLYQLYAFVIPAVADQPRRRVMAVVGGISALFLGGVAFAYFVVLPVALRFLLGFGDGLFETQIRAGEYFSFATTMLLAGGLLFEVPIAMAAFARLGVVTAAVFRRHRRIAICVIALIAAILPGGDPLSMILLMIPQLLLYEVGILLAAALGSTPLWRREAWAAGEDEAP